VLPESASFSAIESRELLLLRVPVNEEAASSQSRELRLNEAKDELHGDHGVDSVPAPLQDLTARVGRMGISCNHHETAGCARLACFCNFGAAAFRLDGSEVWPNPDAGRRIRASAKKQ
jgi:hypothetical protein